MRHYLMYRECKISEITKSSEKLRGFFMHKEGVQKVFGTLDLFLKDLCSGINILSRLFTICIPQTK